MNPFVLALLEICKEDGNTVAVESIRNQAFAKIAAGECKSLISSSVNGKSFSFSLSKAADVLFAESSEAIRLYNNGVVRATEFDFSGI